MMLTLSTTRMLAPRAAVVSRVLPPLMLLARASSVQQPTTRSAASVVALCARRAFQTSRLSSEASTEESTLNKAERLKSRFWKTVTLQPPSSSSSSSEEGSGYKICLDKRPIRTPSGQDIVIPANRPLLANCIAQEWAEQKATLKPHTLPLTSLAARALEGCSDREEREQIEKDLLRYLENETVCFHETQPKALVELQTQHWDPLLSHINSTYSTNIQPFTGLLGGSHSSSDIEVFRQMLSQLDAFDLAAFERSVLTTKSFLISAALLSTHLTVEQAAQAAEVEVQSQINRWGAVEDSHDVDHADLRKVLGSVAIASHRN